MIISLSHTDLDGSGCQIVLSNTFKEVIYYNTSYAKIKEYLEILDETIRREPSAVFITDLMFRDEDYEELIKLVNKHPSTKFFYIDHHHYDFDLKGTNNLKIVHDETKSATKLTFDFLHSRVNKDIEHLIDCINCYDIHLVHEPNYKAGFVLNELFWNYKQKLFFSRFREPRKQLLTESQKEAYKNIVKEKNELFKKSEKNGTLFKIEDKIILSFLDKYFSFFQVDYDFDMYINIASYGGVSIRFNEKVPEETVVLIREFIFEELKNFEDVLSFGGHVYAWGLSLKDSSPEGLLRFAKKFLEVSVKAFNRVMSS